MRHIVLIAHDLRSTHNVGSLLRTAECMGVHRVYLTGYTPYPHHSADTRLPHLAAKLDKAIEKTALGAATLVAWSYCQTATSVITSLQASGYEIIALEQAAGSTALPDYIPAQKVAIVLGREVEGVDSALQALCDKIVQIPQYGHKESLNVVQAAAMALYHCRFAPAATKLYTTVT